MAKPVIQFSAICTSIISTMTHRVACRERKICGRNLHSFHMLILALRSVFLDHMGKMGLLKALSVCQPVAARIPGHKPNLFLLLHLFLSSFLPSLLPSFTSPQRQRIGWKQGEGEGCNNIPWRHRNYGEMAKSTASSFMCLPCSRLSRLEVTLSIWLTTL